MNRTEQLGVALDECAARDADDARRRILGRPLAPNTPVHEVTIRYVSGDAVTIAAVPAGIAHDLARAVANQADRTIWWQGVRSDGVPGALHVVRVAHVAAVGLGRPPSPGTSS